MVERLLIKNLDDNGLLQRLVVLAKSERVSQIELLLHLAELDDRKLYLPQGYSSLWDYCRRALRFSESITHQRIAVARAIRRFPALIAPLESGGLSLCTASDLVRALTDENADNLIAKAAFKSRREVQVLADTNAAKPRERDVIRRMAPQSTVALAVEMPNVPLHPQLNTESPLATPPPKEVAPSSLRHRISFTANDNVVKKLERLKELLGTSNLENTIDRASDALLDRIDPARRERRRRLRKSKNAHAARKPTPKKEPRRPPQALRDAIMVRDDLRCAYVSRDGVRCTETRFLTIDHIQPYALGGSSTDENNLRCMCAAHNGFLGRKAFGPAPQAPVGVSADKRCTPRAASRALQLL